MKVSIIIPVYNVDKYLQKCVESVVKQTYNNIEIILVDDGSTDQSGFICDKWEEKDCRIKVIHKVNGGLSSARNEGNKHASGNYILYLDSDDYLSTDCVEKLVQMCKITGAQIAIIQMMYISEETNEEVAQQNNESMNVLSVEEAIKASLYQKMYSCCAPAKLYKKEIVNEIDFPVGRVSEDLATCHLFLDKAEKVAYTTAIGYYYRQHENSIMHEFNYKRMDAIEWTRKIEEFCSEKYPNIKKAALCRTFNVAIHLLLDLPQMGETHDKYFGELWNEIKRTRKHVLFNRETRFREKAAVLLSFLGENTLRVVWNSRFAVKR